MFRLDEARAVLDELRPALDEFVQVRADAAELSAALAGGVPTALGGRAELKAAEARCDDLLSQIVGAGVELKGYAPLLLDFPSLLDDEAVQLCWLEGETGLEWYHRTDLGYLGRRRLPD